MSQHQGHGEVGSSHESLTALPRWDTIQSAERPHTRKGSRAIILDNSFVKELLGTREPDPGNSAQQQKPKVPRVLLWLVVVLTTLLVLAIILGAVLGTLHSRARHTHPPQIVATTSSAIPTSTSSVPTPTATPQVSSLAVTGWKTGGSRGYFTIWLFSQDSDGFLSRSTFNSSTGNWTTASRFASAKKGTPLAATALNTAYYVNQTNYTFPGVQFQAEVVYLDNLNYVSEWIFPDKGPEEGQPGSLNQQRYTASDISHIAFYWPELVYQSNGGELRLVSFECRTKNRCWHDSTLPTTDASNGTQLAMIPLTNNLSSLALFYSQEDGAYVSYIDRFGQASEIWGTRPKWYGTDELVRHRRRLERPGVTGGFPRCRHAYLDRMLDRPYFSWVPASNWHRAFSVLFLRRGQGPGLEKTTSSSMPKRVRVPMPVARSIFNFLADGIATLKILHRQIAAKFLFPRGNWVRYSTLVTSTTLEVSKGPGLVVENSGPFPRPFTLPRVGWTGGSVTDEANLDLFNGIGHFFFGFRAHACARRSEMPALFICRCVNVRVLGYNGDSRSLQIVIAFLIGLSLYNATELIILTLVTFQRFKGLYFWSLLISSFGILPYGLGFLIKFFQFLDPSQDAGYLAVVFLTVGWWLMVTGQSVVLWSRLHLVTNSRRVLRWTLYMIIMDAFIFHSITSVLTFGSNSNHLSNATLKCFVDGYSIMEKIQMVAFFLQELVISIIYIKDTLRLLRLSEFLKDDFGSVHLGSGKNRKTMYQLLAINAIIIVMDCALLAVEFANLYIIETTLKGVVYSVKLKLEFAVLGRLVHFVHAQSGSAEHERRERRETVGTRHTLEKSGSGGSQGVIDAQDWPDFVDPERVDGDVTHATPVAGIGEMQGGEEGWENRARDKSWRRSRTQRGSWIDEEMDKHNIG
ncbi:hypothetical protein BCR34DRAFT_663998 [Clohesyomyces aquaticus]|uniref:DUF7703 domain-containing protein n=1 Tax=Clohesyomyces aquaticus TaxID=1231657 RepID=A0A1Y1ZPC0_9PLEO|nr:hypothetical protein BCR34DRAFT_663998 [Clohesyomyces aquaticus]